MSDLLEDHGDALTVDQEQCARVGHEFGDDECVHCGEPFVWPLCNECAAGDHGLHSPTFGVCIGCPCEVTP